MTKFTEVGYAGKDVESIIRDLVGSAVIQIQIRGDNGILCLCRADLSVRRFCIRG